jgi:hypothetical protein
MIKVWWFALNNVFYYFIESRQIDPVTSEYQDEDQSDETVSCICPFNNIFSWINSFYKKHKNKK